MSESQYQWSRKSLNELVGFYYSEIRPVMRDDDYNPDHGRPSYEWLADHGFSGLSYALQEHHDLTVKEFFVEEVGLADYYLGNPAMIPDTTGVFETTRRSKRSSGTSRRSGFVENSLNLQSKVVAPA